MQTVEQFGFTVNFSEFLDDKDKYENVKAILENIVKEASRYAKNTPLVLSSFAEMKFGSCILSLAFKDEEPEIRLFYKDKFFNNINLDDVDEESLENAKETILVRAEKYRKLIEQNRPYPKDNRLEALWQKEFNGQSKEQINISECEMVR